MKKIKAPSHLLFGGFQPKPYHNWTSKITGPYTLPQLLYQYRY
jgi:hypothetical protein